MLIVAVCVFVFGLLRIPYRAYSSAMVTSRVVDHVPFVRAVLNRLGLMALTVALSVFVHLWAMAVHEEVQDQSCLSAAYLTIACLQLHPSRQLLIAVRIALLGLTSGVLVYSFVMAFVAELSPVVDASLVLLSAVHVLLSLVLIFYGVVILRHVRRGVSHYQSAVRNYAILLLVACVLCANFLLVLVVQGVQWQPFYGTWTLRPGLTHLWRSASL